MLPSIACVGRLLRHPEDPSNVRPAGTVGECATHDVKSCIVQLVFEMDADREGFQMGWRRQSRLGTLREFPSPRCGLVVATLGSRGRGISHVLHTFVVHPQFGQPFHSPTDPAVLSRTASLSLTKMTERRACRGADVASTVILQRGQQGKHSTAIVAGFRRSPNL